MSTVVGAARTANATAALPRRVDRRRRLPSSRALVGGLLIAVAAVACFAAYTGAHRPPHQLYVVATHALAPGSRITAADLSVVALDITDPGVRRAVFGAPAALTGASVIAPISAGALVESSEVVGRGGRPGTREVSLTIDRSRAVGGTLKAGEYVDVLGTFGSGAESYTAVMVPHVRVLTVSVSGGTFGTTSAEIIVLAAPDATSAEALADAGIAAQVTLIRAAEQSDSAPVTTVAPYHAPSASGNVTSTSASR